VAFSGDGKYLAAGDDSGVVQVWELDNYKDPMILKGHGHQVWAIAFSPNGRLLASGDRSGQVRLWNLTKRTLQRAFEAHEGAVWSLAFRPDGNQLISAGDMQVRLWTVETDTLLKTLEYKGGRITRAVLSPDGALLAVTTTEGSVRVWDLENASIVREIWADDDVLWSAAFSPDTRHLAAASSDEVVTLGNLATGKQHAAFTGHTGGATDLSYLADGATLVVVDRSGMLHWWDTQTGRRLSDAWSAHPGTSWRLAVHPDGERFATAGDEGKVKVWDDLSVDRACRIAKLAFDTVRRRQYLGPDERSVACD
jgi:WD40 repeat protein